MKRLLLSVLCGFVVPFVYAAVAAPLSFYIESERLKYLLWVPVGWPRILQLRLFNSPRILFIGGTASAVIQIVCDVALYASLTYILLTLRSHRKRKTYTEPPPPPVFGRAE
jgi:hypothetical protein